MRLKKSKTANKSVKLDWDYQPPKINGGKETIDDMSLVVGMYGNYEVTKTGNLVGILELVGSTLICLMKPNNRTFLRTMARF
uniref:hypothetical protein n=1 Tax=Levilactobacillus brevis TaxID=1580 RepID=UPI00398C2C67